MFLYLRDLQNLRDVVYLCDMDDIEELLAWLGLRDVLNWQYYPDSQDFPDLADWQKDSEYFQDLQNWKNWQDLQNWRYELDELAWQDLRDLRGLRGLQYLQDFQYLQGSRGLQYFENIEIQFNKKATFARKRIIQSIALENLAILGKMSKIEIKEIFDYWD